LLDSDGPELGDDLHFVERQRSEEETERQAEAARLHSKTHPRIGVLAIQGNYAAHASALAEAGAIPSLVKTSEDLRLDSQSLDGLVLPGGESTTMLKFLEKRDFLESLKEFCGNRPVFGTCAGAILLAREVKNPPQRSLGLLDAVVERNAYGRQIDSSILTEETALSGGPLEMVFIRAPRIDRVGPGVETLARRGEFPVLVRQKSILAATFHPELSQDRRVHQLFVQIVTESKKSRESTALRTTETQKI
jgi:5'-phosphate synthase pdxT subunit